MIDFVLVIIGGITGFSLGILFSQTEKGKIIIFQILGALDYYNIKSTKKD